MYADDLLLLSPSVQGMQSMLNVCTEYGNKFKILFNAKKTICIAVGKTWNYVRGTLCISNNAIPLSN